MRDMSVLKASNAQDMDLLGFVGSNYVGIMFLYSQPTPSKWMRASNFLALSLDLRPLTFWDSLTLIHRGPKCHVGNFLRRWIPCIDCENGDDIIQRPEEESRMAYLRV